MEDKRTWIERAAARSVPNPADFPLGSEASRAAARALLVTREAASQGVAQKPLRIVVEGLGWEKKADGGGYKFLPLDLEKSTCTRSLCADGTLMEVVKLHGNPKDLGDEALDRWVATFPVTRLGRT